MRPHPKKILTERRQRFVDEYVIDSNATQAAIRAGYSPVSARVTGCRLLANANVQSAINIARAAHATRLCVNVDTLTAELEEARAAALAAGQTGAAVAASLGKAKLHGLFVKHAQVTHYSIDDMTPEELDREIARLEEELAQTSH